MAVIQVGKKWALVSPCDADLARGHKWHLRKGYAQTHIRIDGRRTTITLGRLILGLQSQPQTHVDHWNRQPLDNRRGNLRPGPSKLNRQNTGAQGGSSRYRGVYWDKRKRVWRARVMLDGRKYSLGLFATEDAAGQAVEVFRRSHMPWVFPDPALA